ncbi:MAG: TnpV protein [Anaerobutyricum sp.]
MTGRYCKTDDIQQIIIIQKGRWQGMNLAYERNGDYRIPNLIPSEQEGTMLTKYGVLRKNYLKNHRRGIYTGLLLSGQLLTHCLEIQEQAEERFEVLTQKLSKNQTVTEELKQNDPLQWTKEMNRIYQQAEEIVLKELVYQ